MNISCDKGMLMRKLAIYEFGCRNIFFMFESLSIYCLCQKRLEAICYCEIVKPNIVNLQQGHPTI